MKAKGQITPETYTRWSTDNLSAQDQADIAIIVQNSGGYYSNGRVMMEEGIMHIPLTVVELAATTLAGHPEAESALCAPNPSHRKEAELDSIDRRAKYVNGAVDGAEGGAVGFVGGALLLGLLNGLASAYRRRSLLSGIWGGLKGAILGGTVGTGLGVGVGVYQGRHFATSVAAPARVEEIQSNCAAATPAIPKPGASQYLIPPDPSKPDSNGYVIVVQPPASDHP